MEIKDLRSKNIGERLEIIGRVKQIKKNFIVLQETNSPEFVCFLPKDMEIEKTWTNKKVKVFGEIWIQPLFLRNGEISVLEEFILNLETIKLD